MSSNLLLSIINDILDLSKIEAGKLELEHTSFNLQAILEDLCGIIKYQTAQKGLRLIFNYSNNVPANVTGDPVRVRQIVMNLLSNALKFTSEGSIELNVTEGDKKAELIIEVKDTGIGIVPEKIEMLFDKFTQEDSSTTRKYGGSGLGLSICKMLTEKMGGSISVKSKKGEGSSFAVYLPLKSAKDEIKVAKIGDIVFHWLRKPEILMAEDSHINRKIAVAMLEHCGCSVEVAENGKIAIEKSAEKDYDLVLMDLQMPEMGGIEASEVIVKMKRHLPIVAITANTMPQEKEKCLAAGMKDFLIKPVRKAELAGLLKKQLAHLLVSGENEETAQQEEKRKERSFDKLEKLQVFNAEAAKNVMGGNEDLLKKMSAIFIKNVPEDLRLLKGFVENKDMDSIKRLVHKMRSESGLIGGERVSEASFELERACNNRECEKAEALALALGKHLKELEQTLSL